MAARNHARLAPKARRQLILEHARALLWSEGVPSFTVRDIASAAGVSIGTVTHHFSSSSEIVEGVLRIESERVRARVREAVRPRTSAIDGIDRLIGVALVDDPEMRQFWTIWLAAGARSAHDTTLAGFFAERYRTWRDVLRALIDEGTSSGEFSPHDPGSVTTAIVALIDGYGLHSFFDRSLSAADARAEVMRMTRQLLLRDSAG